MIKAGDIAESTIIDLLKKNEMSCPICQGITMTINMWLESTISNLMHNYEAREKIMSGGLCEKHSTRIITLAKESSDVGSLGASMVYEELLKRQIDVIGKEKGGNSFFPGKKKPDSSCYLCDLEIETEIRYVNTFKKLFNDKKMTDLYQKSKRVFCVSHTDKLLEAKLNKATSKWFVEIQKVKLENMLYLLKTYISKHDYRNTEPFGTEADSWKLVSKIVGEKRA